MEASAAGGLADRASVARVRVDSVPGDLAAATRLAPAWQAQGLVEPVAASADKDP